MKRNALTERTGRTYFGQTGRSIHARMKEFRHGLTNRNLKYSFTKHTNEYHHQMTTLPAFKVEVEGKCRVDFVRLLTESQKI